MYNATMQETQTPPQSALQRRDAGPSAALDLPSSKTVQIWLKIK